MCRCCADGVHCCPLGYVCSGDGQSCMTSLSTHPLQDTVGAPREQPEQRVRGMRPRCVRVGESALGREQLADLALVVLAELEAGEGDRTVEQPDVEGGLGRVVGRADLLENARPGENVGYRGVVEGQRLGTLCVLDRPFVGSALSRGEEEPRQSDSRAHLHGGRRVARAEARVRQQRHLGREPEAPDLLRGELRAGGDPYRIRIGSESGVEIL